MPETLRFPPQMYGEPVDDDPLTHAAMRAVQGCDAGLVTYRIASDRLGAALVFAPEVPLRKAAAMLPLCGVGFQNALGALAPPEVAVHLEWPGDIRINGARCGALRALSSTLDPDETPDWLIIGLTLPLLSLTDAPGETHDETALYEEGCADVDPAQLIEAWARHVLNWIARWESEGVKALHTDWRGMAHGIGEPLTLGDDSGTFLGIDEDFGLILRRDTTTRVLPLTGLIKDTP